MNHFEMLIVAIGFYVRVLSVLKLRDIHILGYPNWRLATRHYFKITYHD